MTDVPAVDIHPHIISSDNDKYPKAPLGGTQSDWSKDRPATWEQLSTAMDQAAVVKAAVVQSSTTYGHDNSYLADSVDGAQGRITGVCSAGFMDDDAVERIKYWIDDRGMSGLRLFTSGSTMAQTDWFADEKTNPAWAYVTDEGIPVCVALRPSALPQLRRVLERFPGVRIVLDHVGRTDFSEGPPYRSADAVYELADFPGLYLKVTSSNLRRAGSSEGGSQALLRELIGHFGSDRIAWGSNWPSATGELSDLVALLRAATADLASSDRANICSGTAVRLYPKLG